MQTLPLFHRIAGRPVIVLGQGEAAEAKRRLVERAGGIVAAESEADARLALVAFDDPAEAEQAAARLRARGVLVNVADRPDLCDFILPAIVDREPVLVAVGTGGASAGLAKWLRLRLEALLPGDLGQLALALRDARERIRRRWPDAAERRRALDAALAPAGALDPMRDGAEESVDAWLRDEESGGASEILEIVLHSDDPDDLTLKEARLLGCADLVLHAPDVPAAILDRARADAVRRPLGSEASGSGLTIVLRSQC